MKALVLLVGLFLSSLVCMGQEQLKSARCSYYSGQYGYKSVVAVYTEIHIDNKGISLICNNRLARLWYAVKVEGPTGVSIQAFDTHRHPYKILILKNGEGQVVTISISNEDQTLSYAIDYDLES